MYPNCNVGGASFSPYYPTAMPQVSQPLQQSPLVPTPSIKGLVVNRVEDIAPNLIPTDGSKAVFPLNDDSAIYVKSLNPDWSVSTIKYVPEVVEETPTEPPLTNQDIVELINKRIDELVDMLSTKPSTKVQNGSKKEVANG